MAEGTQKPAFYTIDQLMQLVNTGACQIASPADDDKVCAEKTEAALADPSKLKIPGTKRVRFTVQNTNEEKDLYFGMGEALSRAGLTALYPGSVFSGLEGANYANFFTGDNLIPLASGPNSLASQSKATINPRLLISRLAIVRVDQSDPILANDMQFERIFPSNGKAVTEQVSPECNACAGGSNSNLITAVFNLGLVPSDERNAWGVLIPKKVAQVAAVKYTIDVDFMFTEGAYGYVAVAADGIGCGPKQNA